MNGMEGKPIIPPVGKPEKAAPTRRRRSGEDNPGDFNKILEEMLEPREPGKKAKEK